MVCCKCGRELTERLASGAYWCKACSEEETHETRRAQYYNATQNRYMDLTSGAMSKQVEEVQKHLDGMLWQEFIDSVSIDTEDPLYFPLRKDIGKQP